MQPRPGERNNFDLLRFLLALVVVFYHLPVLTADPRLAIFAHANGTVAVLGFFAISGYVIAGSWERSGSWRRYAARRARRLLPGYFFVVLAAFGGGAALTSLPLAEYLRSVASWKYLTANLTMLNFLAPSLPGVFTGNPTMAAVNGSLWSIRAEAFCYVLAPAVALWMRPAWTPVFGFLLAGFGAAALFLSSDALLDVIRIGVVNPVQCFLLGMAVYAAGLKQPVLLAAGGLGGLGLLAESRGWVGAPAVWFGWGLVLCGTAAILGAGLGLPYLGNATRLGQLSYGLYLWHFPVIQTAVSFGWFARNPWLAATGCLGAALLLAAASWHWVERPFLRPDNHYRRLTGEPAKADSG